MSLFHKYYIVTKLEIQRGHFTILESNVRWSRRKYRKINGKTELKRGCEIKDDALPLSGRGVLQ